MDEPTNEPFHMAKDAEPVSVSGEPIPNGGPVQSGKGPGENSFQIQQQRQQNEESPAEAPKEKPIARKGRKKKNASDDEEFVIESEDEPSSGSDDIESVQSSEFEGEEEPADSRHLPGQKNGPSALQQQLHAVLSQIAPILAQLGPFLLYQVGQQICRLAMNQQQLAAQKEGIPQPSFGPMPQQIQPKLSMPPQTMPMPAPQQQPQFSSIQPQPSPLTGVAALSNSSMHVPSPTDILQQQQQQKMQQQANAPQFNPPMPSQMMAAPQFNPYLEQQQQQAAMRHQMPSGSINPAMLQDNQLPQQQHRAPPSIVLRPPVRPPMPQQYTQFVPSQAVPQHIQPNPQPMMHQALPHQQPAMISIHQPNMMQQQNQMQQKSTLNYGYTPAMLKINIKDLTAHRQGIVPSANSLAKFSRPAPAANSAAIQSANLAVDRPRRQRKEISYVQKEEETESERSQSEADVDINGPADEVMAEDDGGVEKILSMRHSNEAKANEFLVKWRNKSWIHLDWISEDELKAEPHGVQRIKRFTSKPLAEHHYSKEHVFNPIFAVVEKVIADTLIAEKDQAGNDVRTPFFLCKWTSLPYDLVSWESISEVKGTVDGEKRIEEYVANVNPDARRCPAVAARPPKRDWVTLETSPTYKDSNQLRDYQLEGVNWLLFCWFNRQSCIIADEMGLGKTIQSIAFLDQIYSRYKMFGPFLIVAPLSTLPHWEREIATWTQLRAITYHGTIASRDVMYDYEFFYKNSQGQIIPGVYKFDVLITTYEMALAGVDHLANIHWRVGIFDEAHRLKNKASKASEVLSTYRIEHKVLATGTPLQNSLEELWALLNFIDPIKFAEERVFLGEFGSLKKSEDVTRIQQLLKPLMLRRMKEDVEKSIPVKEETIVEVELTSVQKRYYRAILEKNLGFLKKGMKGTNAPNLINAMMELRKCCIHPYLIKGAEERILQESEAITPAQQYEAMIQASGKLVLVDKLLKKLKEGGHKVLIFSQMVKCLDILSDFLKFREYNFERIDGAVRGEFRQAAIDRFCAEGSEGFVFLLCTRAGGMGINLTAADTVIIYDSDWNPQNDIQAQARCHRIGQTKSVKIYRLVTRNTYERDMFDRAGLKLGLDKAVLQKMGPSVNNASVEGEDDGMKPTSALSKKDIETLLKKGAYGVLMETDEDSMKFCEEDIDQILERRTTVIKHDVVEPGQSFFSKASFRASDDVDIDINDPNFWEMWAKQSKVDSSQDYHDTLLMDEPRIRRQSRRIKIVEIESDEEALPDSVESEMESSEWTDALRARLMRCLLRYGFGNVDAFLPLFPGFNKQQLLAGSKALLKYAIDLQSEADTKMKEDCEKLLLGKLAELEIEADPERKRAVEDKVIVGEWADSSSEKEVFIKKSHKLLMRLQLLEFARIVASPCSETGYKGITVPVIQGGSPADWWNAEDDGSLIFGTFKHGFQEYAAMNADPELHFSTRTYLESAGEEVKGPRWPDKTALNTRLKRLLVTMQKRSAAEAKMQLSTIKGKRKRNTMGGDEGEFVPATEETPTTGKKKRGRKSTIVDDDDEKALTSPSKKKSLVQTSLVGSQSSAGKWSKRERTDLINLILNYGLPASADENRDYQDYKVILSIEKKADTAIARMVSDVIKNCEEIAGQDEEDFEEGDEIKPILAAKLLKNVDLFDSLRREVLTLPPEDLTEKLKGAEKPTKGFPSWYSPSEHDAAFLEGLNRYGITRPDLFVSDPELPFYSIYKEANASPGPKSRRKSKNASAASEEKEPETFEPEKIGWPSEDQIQERFEYLVHAISPQSK